MTQETRDPKKLNSLVEGPVGKALTDMAVPMFFGIGAIILFTVVDTYFVGQLGEDPLAAMGFCFPVILFIQNVAMGVGTGATSVISRAIGAGDQERVRRLTTHSLILALLLVVLVSLLGVLAVEPLFTQMGAKPELLPLIREYMVPWLLGVGFLVIPMVSNSALRATGDTKSPAVIMIVAGVVNVLLDPILIFGWGPIPRLELLGAALATIGSWLAAFAGAGYYLHVRYRMLTNPLCGGVIESWKQILVVGVPAAGTMVLVPLSTGVLTRMVADFGKAAVGAFGVASRIDALALVGIFAVSSSVAPFVGQNFGAQKCGRIRRGLRLALGFSLAWGAFMATLLSLGASPVASLFSKKPEVVESLIPYLHIVPWGYGLLGMAMMTTSTFNALNRPLRASLVILVRLFVLAIPLAALGARWNGLTGLFSGIVTANVLTGLFALTLVWSLVSQLEREQDLL